MKTIWIIIAILVVLGIGWYFINMSKAPTTEIIPTPAPTPTAFPTKASTSPTPTPENKIIVEMTAAGFVPSEINIKPGTTVDFVNKDTVARWPASSKHPAHLDYPGFDAKKGIQPGEIYTFTFNMVKSIGVHDHLNPKLFGKINVAP